MENLKLLLKSGLKILGSGFCWGTGFVLGIIAASLLATPFTMDFNKLTESFTGGEQCYKSSQCMDEGQLSVQVTGERIGHDHFILLGRIVNAGKLNWRYIRLRAEIFDKDSKFIDQCTDVIMRTVSSKQSINFKLSCPDYRTDKINLKNYGSYTLAIESANAS